MADYQVHGSSYVDDGASIGEGTRIWHFCHIQSGATIGRNCSLGQNVNVASGVKIGNGVRIQNNVSVYEGVEIEDNVFCGPSCVFTNVTTPRAHFPVHGVYAHTFVKEGASLGANCTVVCGHTIGRSALIAAGAVVTHDVPDYALMAGVPARRIGWVCECGHVLDESARNSGGQVFGESTRNSGGHVSGESARNSGGQVFGESARNSCGHVPGESARNSGGHELGEETLICSCGRKYRLADGHLSQIETFSGAAE